MKPLANTLQKKRYAQHWHIKGLPRGSVTDYVEVLCYKKGSTQLFV
jgi:hypothetical protein